MKTIGLTGGIGMGKSAAAQWLQSHGIAVVDTDDLARAVVEPGQPALDEIKGMFGGDVIGDDGKLRRNELAHAVFADAAARKKLEAILHPRIHDLWSAQLDIWRAENKPLAVVIIPLLFETGAEREFDAVVCIACSVVTQRDRLRLRGWTDEEIQRRIAAQMPVTQKMERSNHVVWSEGDLEVFHLQIMRIIASIEPKQKTCMIGG